MFYAPFNISGTLEASALKFYTRCTGDGANSYLSHCWLAFIGANEGGSKNWVNFGIFKNHSGGPKGGQISTDRSKIYTRGGGWLATSFVLNNNYPQCGPPGGQIYANIAILLLPFGRTLNPLKMHRTWVTTPLHNLYKGCRKLQLLLNVAFSGGAWPDTVQRFGGFLHRSYREHGFV